MSEVSSLVDAWLDWWIEQQISIIEWLLEDYVTLKTGVIDKSPFRIQLCIYQISIFI